MQLSVSAWDRAGLALCWLLVTFVSPTAAEVPPVGWHPQSEYMGKFDWIQMTSGEWVKGRIIALYDGDLEFDSDEFSMMTLDWQNITQIRTSQVVSVGLLGRRSVTGKLVLTGAEVAVYGDQLERFEKEAVLTIIAGTPTEREYWTTKLFTGVIVRSGNTDVREFNLQADVQRRTIRHRFVLDAVLNENATEGVEIASNRRVGAKWDTFINSRLFVTLLAGEYFRDPFQNIRARFTLGVAAGYQLMDTPKIDWTISAGPGYQDTRFESVVAEQDDKESTAALIFGTRAGWDIIRSLAVDGLYRFQLVDEASGTYSHHFLVSFETSITKLIDFDLSWIWDRIQDPHPGANGEIPKPDDFRTTVGLDFEF